jgi:beta-lactamase regulating signal transducer with metallopeptidase domain
MLFFDLLASTTQFILDTTLKASILAILIFLIQMLFRNKIPAKWLHALWLLVIIRMLLPFELESRLSMFNLVPAKNDQKFIDESVVIPIEKLPAMETNIAENNTPIVAPIEFSESSKQVINFLPIHYFSIIWMLGIIVFIKNTLTNNLKFLNRIKGQRRISEKGIINLFYQCKKEMKIQSEIGLVEVVTTQVPLLYGIFRPRILLPFNFVNRNNSEELRHIFLHELAHYKRHDIKISLLTSILQIIHWFNPIIWYAFFRMRIDRELATDEKTLSLIGSEKSQSYGQTIISMLKQISTEFRTPVTVGIIENKSDLKRRITMISNFGKRSMVWSLTAVIILLTLALFSFTKAQKQKPLVSEISIKIEDNNKVKINNIIVIVDSLKHKLKEFRFDEKSVISILPDEDVNMDTYFKVQNQLQTINCKNIKYINTKSGKSVTTPQYNYKKLHHVFTYDPSGLQPVKINGKFGYKNKDDEVIIEPKYDQAQHFENGFALVRVGEKWGMISNKSENVTAIKFGKLHSFMNGAAEFRINNKWGFIDTTGNIIIHAKFERAYPFSEGLASVMLNTKWGFINKKGDFLIEPQFDGCQEFREGLAAVKKSGKWGFINKTGELIIEHKFNEVERFSDGLALVRENGKYGYINKTGNFVIKSQYENADSFSEGLAAIKINGKYGYINTDGEVVIEPKYDFAINFMLGSAHVTIFEKPEFGTKGQSFWIDKAGNILQKKK